jgi:hypothetical protein
MAEKSIFKKFMISKILGSGLLFKNIRLILFIAFLALIYIYNGHQSNKTIRNIKTVAGEVKEMEAAYKNAKSKVMAKTSIGALSAQAAPLGLQEFTEPPFKLLNTDTILTKH